LLGLIAVTPLILSSSSRSQFLRDQLAVYRFDFAFVDLVHSSFSLFCPSIIDLFLIRTDQTFEKITSEHRARLWREFKRGTEKFFECA
jgi:hypothetical protein